MGIHFIITEKTLGRITKGAFHFGLSLYILNIIAFEAAIAEAIQALVTSQNL
jgi:hypothetical protein